MGTRWHGVLVALGLLLGDSGGAWAAAGDLPPLSEADKNTTVRIWAGGVGWDHGMPYMAAELGIWEKYGLKVDFKFGNPPLAVQVTQTGQFEASYMHNMQVLTFNDKGVPAVVGAATSMGSAAVIASPTINSAEDLKGKKYGVITKFDGMHVLFQEHILPAHGVKPDEMIAVQVPFTEAALTLKRGDIAAYFMWEPIATQAATEGGVKILWDWKETWNNGEFFRNCLVLNKTFVKERPALAKRVVWAHLDGLNFIRRNPERATDIMTKWSKITARKWFEVSLKKTDFSRDIIPDSWFDAMEKDLKKLGLVSPDYRWQSGVDFSLHQGYVYRPGPKEQ